MYWFNYFAYMSYKKQSKKKKEKKNAIAVRKNIHDIALGKYCDF